jgi:LacI family transcriptional regulator
VNTPNIRDVAGLAGVSVGAVSKVLNGNVNVRIDTARRVKAAANKLGYRLPADERRSRRIEQGSLKRKDLVHGRFALLYLDRGRHGFAGALTRSLTAGMQQRLFERKLHLSLTNLKADGSLPDEIANKEVDGVFVRGSIHVPQLSPHARDLLGLFPRVNVMGIQGDCFTDGMDRIQPNNALIGALAAQRALALGSKRPVVICPSRLHISFCQRSAGFLCVCRVAGLDPVLIETDSSDANWRSLWRAGKGADFLFITHDDKNILPALRLMDARSDFLAITVVRDAKEVDGPAHFHYISTNAEQVGYQAADQLLWRIEHPAAPPIQVEVEPEYFS